MSDPICILISVKKLLGIMPNLLMVYKIFPINKNVHAAIKKRAGRYPLNRLIIAKV